MNEEEQSALASLANSCEYLTTDKTCAVFNDNSQAKANRQLKCKNSQNATSCCYLCVFRLQCVIRCKYLGQSENNIEPQYATENTCTDTVKELTVETLPSESVPVSFCDSCNVEMAWAKTQFTVDNWKGNTVLLFNDKVLPVTVLLCPRCGKIEFKAAADAIRKEAK
jgi:hypothetical protein